MAVSLHRALFAGLILLAAVSSARAAEPIEVSGDYVHPKSGFVFPEKFGKLERTGVARFDPAGNDVAIGYDVLEGDVQLAATIYVTPPARTKDGERLSLEQHFKREAASIMQLQAKSTSSPPWTPKQTKNLEEAPGHAILFRYVASFHGKSQPVESLFQVFEYEGWVVKYRITYPESQSKRANVLAQVLPQIFLLKGGK
jgi:hypothetical protein